MQTDVPEFPEASAVEVLEPGRYRAQIHPGWFQGPGAFGGLTGAILLRAMAGVVDDEERRPRELSGQFCARVKQGPALVEARVARAGLNVSFVTAEMRQRDRVVATASSVFSVARPDGVAYDELRAPTVPAPEACPIWTLPTELPVYTRNLDLRQCWDDADRPSSEALIWVRPKAPQPLDAPLTAALLDCFMPAFFIRVPDFRPAGTVGWSVHFLAELPLAGAADDAHYLLRVRSPVASAGYSSEDDELWTADGRLIARARQLVAAL